MKNILIPLLILLCTSLQAAPEYVPQAAFDSHPRTGIGNTLAKLQAGEHVTIAYFGGSITAQNGWRPKTTQFFSECFPQADITEIHAAIGGTGSDLGVFRLDYDVLRHNPDLVFVEFATNDGGTPPKAIWKQMEGIVRQIWKHNSHTDIVFVYTVMDGTVRNYQRGHLHRAAGAMEMLADFYGIPTICFGKRIARLLDEGKLVMSGETAPEGVILFAKDGVHPTDEGHELYLADVKAAYEQLKPIPGVDHAPQLAKVFIEGNYENAKMVSIRPEMLQGDWHQLKEGDRYYEFTERTGEMWHSNTPGSTLTFRFRGTVASLYDLLAPNAAQVCITVDGKRDEAPAPRFDSYCSWTRLATLGCFSASDTSEAVHEITIEIDSVQPDRHIVREYQDGDPAYDGTNWWVGKIMLIGDLVE